MTGQDCPLNTIVQNAAECKLAAVQLQMTYQYVKTYSAYPAGCYGQEDTKSVWFNGITNPNRKTYPITFKWMAGICKGIAIYFIYHMHF